MLLVRESGTVGPHADVAPDVRDFFAGRCFRGTGAERLSLASESVTQAGAETTATGERRLGQLGSQ